MCNSVNILQDYSTSQELLNCDNIDFSKLQQYSLDAAHFSIDLPELDFAVSDHVMSCDALYCFFLWCSLVTGGN